jgi:excisionase family DNA binding protein
MPRTRLNPRRAKLHHPYSVDEVARLYDVHRNTVRAWLKSGGLEAIDGGRPILIKGAVLRAFLEVRRQAAKRPCPPGTIYCFSCRAPRRPALGMADFMPRPQGAGDLSALCEACGTTMHRRAGRDALDRILPGLPVRVMGAEPRIADPTTPSDNCDLEATEPA